MAARASFSNDSRIVKMPLPKSLLLKDYLLDDMSSCSSNGFRSYPRRQCFTTVRYLIEIDLNKHIKLPPTQKQKQFLKSESKSKAKARGKTKSKSKSKSVSVLHKASAAVVNVFKHLQFTGSGKPRKACFLPRNLSRKLSKWKKTTNHQNKHFERLKSFDDEIKEKENILPRSSKVSTGVTTTTNNSNSNSLASSDSCFTATSDSSTTGSSSKINVAQNDVEESEQQATEKKNTANRKKVGGATATATATNDSAANGNAKKQLQEEKEQISPVSVIDFPCDDEDDEVTSPFQLSRLYMKGRKHKLIPKVRRNKSLIKLEPVRLEDRIALSESRTQNSTLESDRKENQIEKKAIALLQLLKATMPSHNLFESTITDNVLLGFFNEQINKGNVSNLEILQEAKDWMDGNRREMAESQNYKITYIRDMETRVKWLKFDDEKVVLELEYEVFASLIDEMLLEF